MRSCDSSQLARRPAKSGTCITEGGADEKGVRLFEGSPQSLRGAIEASGNDPAGRAHDQVLQGAVSRVGNPLPDPNQPLPSRLCGHAEAAVHGLEVGCVVGVSETHEEGEESPPGTCGVEGWDGAGAPRALQGRGGSCRAEADSESRPPGASGTTRAYPGPAGPLAQVEPVACGQNGGRRSLGVSGPSHSLPACHGNDSERAGTCHG